MLRSLDKDRKNKWVETAKRMPKFVAGCLHRKRGNERRPWASEQVEWTGAEQHAGKGGLTMQCTERKQAETIRSERALARESG